MMGKAVIISHAKLLPSAGTQLNIFLDGLKKSLHLSPVLDVFSGIKSQWSERSLNSDSGAKLDVVMFVWLALVVKHILCRSEVFSYDARSFWPILPFCMSPNHLHTQNWLCNNCWNLFSLRPFSRLFIWEMLPSIPFITPRCNKNTSAGYMAEKSSNPSFPVAYEIVSVNRLQ